MTPKLGVFDHVGLVSGQRLDQIYRDRLIQIEPLAAAGFATEMTPHCAARE